MQVSVGPIGEEMPEAALVVAAPSAVPLKGASPRTDVAGVDVA